MLTESVIIENWEYFIKEISDWSDDKEEGDPANRWDLLLDFYSKHANRFATMPASGKLSFHSAYPGGHIDHTIRVYKTCFKLKKLWESMGAEIDFTDESLAFVALNHDIGKFGTEDQETFVDQDSQWHRDRGEVYKHNPKLPFMKDYDRSIFILQSLGVTMSEDEFLAIKLQAGLYEESNKSYFMAFSEEYKLRSNLPYILHQADAVSARIESQMSSKILPKPVSKPKRKK